MVPVRSGSTPARTINWLFFDLANDRSDVIPTIIFANSFDNPVLLLNDWADVLWTQFKFRLDESTLQFFRPSSPLNVNSISQDWLRTHTDITTVGNWCQPAFYMADALGDDYDRRHVHFLITAKEVAEESPPATEERDLLSELPLHVKHRRLNQARAPIIPPPSLAATSREYARLQEDPGTVIYDGFYVRGTHQVPAVVTIAPPIEIFHPVFREFLDMANDTTLPLDEGVVSNVSALMPIAMEVHSKEANAFAKLRPVLSRLLGIPVTQLSSHGGRAADGVVVKQLNAGAFPILCCEYKCAVGEGGCDPLTQAAYSVREFFVGVEKLRPIVDKCCCPCFLLAGAGPYLCILGVVFTDILIVQRLTDIMWAGEATTCEDARVYHLSRVFGSLRHAIAALDKYYGQVSIDENIPPLVENEPHPRLFPYPTRFKEHSTEANKEPMWIEFKYTDACGPLPTNVTFIAKDTLGRKLVIKFVDRYGLRAHELLADAGMAPKLLYFGLLDGEKDIRNTESRAEDISNDFGLYVGPIRMVVMEHIEGDTLVDAKTLPEDASDQTATAIRKLHDAGLVFGDLRAPNIMVSGGRVILIDFDWAGEEGKARYPRNLSRSVTWPASAKSLEMKPILAKHDSFMLGQLDQVFARRVSH